MKHPFQITLESRFGGCITHGKGNHADRACALEIANLTDRGVWSDSPWKWPDIRRLNDARWSSDQQRTVGLTPVIIAYWDWSTWADEKRSRVAIKLCLSLVRETLTQLPSFPEPECQSIKTIKTLYGLQNFLSRVIRQYGVNETLGHIYRGLVQYHDKEHDTFFTEYIMLLCAYLPWAVSREVIIGEECDRILHHACKLWVKAARGEI